MRDSPHISADNSWGRLETQTLSAGQTLTGTADRSPLPDLRVSAYVEGGSATLHVDLSIDNGTNWDRTQSYAVAPSQFTSVVTEKGLSSFRVRVEAGADNLTAVRVQTECGVYQAANESAQSAGVSALNSTSTALSNGATYTGTWEDVGAFDSMVVAVKTDQDGTYTVQFSPDGVNADSTLSRYYRTTQIEPPHRFTITRRFARVTFTNNSGADQTYLRLQTSYGVKQSLNIPTDATMAQDYDAIATRPTSYTHEVALGRRQGHILWNKFGYNNDVDTGTEIIAAFGGSFSPLKTASTLTTVSASTADESSGTGARSILIQGVDANRVAQNEVVTMNGTTTVVSTSTWLGINRAVVYTSGTADANVGDISITATTGGSNQAVIPAGNGVTQQLIFHIQADHVGLADWLEINAQRAGPATAPIVQFKGWVYSPTTDSKYEVFRQTINTNVQTEVQFAPASPFVFSPQDVFWIEATTDQNNTQVSGRFTLIEVRNVDA